MTQHHLGAKKLTLRLDIVSLSLDKLATVSAFPHMLQHARHGSAHDLTQAAVDPRRAQAEAMILHIAHRTGMGFKSLAALAESTTRSLASIAFGCEPA